MRTSFGAAAAGVVLLLSSHAARAQSVSDRDFARVSSLSRAGQMLQARSLVDSLIGATPSREMEFPALLLLRASIAANRSDADKDLRRIVADYPGSPRRADALLALAQEAISAGEPDSALGSLRQLSNDYREPRYQATAEFWAARALMEKGETIAACESNDRAMEFSSAVSAALKNQITTFATKTCSRSLVVTPDSEASDSLVSIPVSRDTPRVSRPPKKITKPPAKVIAPPAAPGIPPTPAAVTPPSGSSSYSVQVAAFDTRTPAEKLAARLRKSGLAARVDGSVKPFRVRIGKYATYRDAAAALRDLKSRKLSGFVAEVQE